MNVSRLFLSMIRSAQITVALTAGTFFVTCSNIAGSQPRHDLQVALFLYEGVELLDFSGPGEVFGATQGFQVFTVSVDGKAVLSQGFLSVQPRYSIDDAPPADVIVFPGGRSGPSSGDPKVLAWIKDQAARGAFIMSVCTGAGIVGSAGILDGLNVTTWHGYIAGLQAKLPDSKVLEDTRFVDSGSVITTAGVSAGIDGALHLVSRIRGIDVAKATAYYMEYDKWEPQEGRIDFSNQYIEQLKQAVGNPEWKYNPPVIAGSGQKLPFEGELKNLGFEFEEKGMIREAANVFEATTKLYPGSASSFLELGKLYRELGRPTPMEESSFLQMIRDGRIDEALAVYAKMQESFAGWKIFREGSINILGYQYMQKEDYHLAIKIFQLNVLAYPDSFNAFDSLGEAFMMAGDKDAALHNYRKSLELNPGNENARKFITELER